jgi:DNA-binding transcriptional LysR family regulator
LAVDGTIAVKRLSGESFVLLDRQSSPGLYDEVLALCAGNFSPHVVSEPNRLSTVLLLVESGIGISIVSGSARHMLRSGGHVVFCRLQPVSAPLELRMNWRRSTPPSPTVEAFRKVVQSQRETICALMEARPAEKKR